MTSNPERRNANVLDALTQHFEQEGFEVFIDPPRSMLPHFMEGYHPDAIAVRADKKIAIEIKRSSRNARRFDQLAKVFATEPGWELRFYYDEPRTPTDLIKQAPLSTIEGAVQQIIQLRSAGQFLPALLVARATFEALARGLIETDTTRPTSVSRLVEALASRGWLTPKDADAIRGMVSMWNSATHGQLDIVLDGEQLDQLITILRTLLQAAEEEHSSNK